MIVPEKQTTGRCVCCRFCDYLFDGSDVKM